MTPRLYEAVEHEDGSGGPDPTTVHGISFFQRWGPLIMAIAAALVAWGSWSSDLKSVKDDVTALKLQQITPGAAQKIAVLEAQIAQLNKRDDELSGMIGNARKEMLDWCTRIEAKADKCLENRSH